MVEWRSGEERKAFLTGGGGDEGDQCCFSIL